MAHASRPFWADGFDLLHGPNFVMAIPGGSEEIMLDLGVKQSTKLAQMAKMFAEAAPAAQPAKL